jgi:1-acyl-sn-glycerol-3-phosphate acyltransferase
MAKSELWHNRAFGMMLNSVLAFPVRRGGADRTALTHAGEVLRDGGLVGIFPEGTRHRADSEELGEANEGVAFIALRADVPVVPVGIEGTQKALPRGARFPRFPRVTIVFGEPVDSACCPDASRKERVKRMTALVMNRISDSCHRAKES